MDRTKEIMKIRYSFDINKMKLLIRLRNLYAEYVRKVMTHEPYTSLTDIKEVKKNKLHYMNNLSNIIGLNEYNVKLISEIEVLKSEFLNDESFVSQKNKILNYIECSCNRMQKILNNAFDDLTYNKL